MDGWAPSPLYSSRSCGVPSTAQPREGTKIVNIKCGQCGGRHGSVAEVRACSTGGGSAVAVEERQPKRYGDQGSRIFNPSGEPSSSAVQYLRNLLDEREVEPGYRKALEGYLSGDMTAHGVSTAIERLKPLPKRSAKVDQDGMYRDPGTGTIFKVQVAIHGSGELYAKRLQVEATDESGTSYTGRFVYAPGAIRRLRPEWRLTLEEAQEFGKLYGVCCVCGTTLTNEDSIDAGIGPVCAGKFRG